MNKEEVLFKLIARCYVVKMSETRTVSARMLTATLSAFHLFRIESTCDGTN